MILYCSIYVIFGVFGSMETVKGVLKGENKEYYLVDFSEDVRKRGFRIPEEYRNKILKKDRCVPLKGNN